MVKLTDLATAGGCAAKYSAARLDELLRGFVPAEAENLLVGLDPADDAAVYRLDDERALVFTIDFFPPIVDDPDDFGAIAATNALNDVFAMGGTPLLALSVAALPEELPTEVVRAIFDGADRQVRAAGRSAGRRPHDPRREPKYGLAVVGTVALDGIWPKSRRAPGDALYLTKPLGTALVLGGAKRGLADRPIAVRMDAHAEPRRGRRRCGTFTPNAVTDVTGFGLLGHAHEMACSQRRSAASSTRRRCRRSTARSTRRGPASRRPGTRNNRAYAAGRGRRRRGRARRARLRPADRGRAARLAAGATRGPRCEAEFARAGLFLARIGDGRGRRRASSFRSCAVQCARGRQRGAARPPAGSCVSLDARSGDSPGRMP